MQASNSSGVQLKKQPSVPITEENWLCMISWLIVYTLKIMYSVLEISFKYNFNSAFHTDFRS